MRRNVKNILILILLICIISVGYSLLETNLSVLGIIDISKYEPPPITVDDLIAKSNPINKNYNSSSTTEKGEMYTFSHPQTEQTPALTDYRYIGSIPNNYIKFNNELWRIIGVFSVDDGTGKIENRIKIIRDESIGEYSWDNKDKATGAGTDNGVNSWSDARIMKLLNPGFDSEIVGGSLFYNRSSGICYAGQKNATVSCNFTNVGLTSEAKSQIDVSKYFLGGIEQKTVNYGTGSDIYASERGIVVSSGNSINWNGIVGLIYPSDYIYTFANGVNDLCFNDIVSCFSSDSWLYNSTFQWTISSYPVGVVYVFYLHPNGPIANYFAYDTYDIRPVVYLNSDVRLTGIGTSGNPYIIK